jgi:phospholipid/cholesterol/gamma-HCH transport system substrate-binding protein
VSDRKYILVGLFVLIGLILLGTLIVWFRGFTGFLRGGYNVNVHMVSSQGIRAGKPVNMDGLSCGYVTEVSSSLPEQPGVWIRIHVIDSMRIPKDSMIVAQQTAVGDIYLDFRSSLKVQYPLKDTDYLPMDGSARLSGIIKGPSLLPEGIVEDLHTGIAELKNGMDQLKEVGTVLANLKELTEPRTLEDLKTGKRKNLWTTLEQFDATALSVQNSLDKPDSQFGQLLTEVRKAATDLRTVMDKAGKTVENVDKAVASIDEAGKGIQTVSVDASVFLKKLSKDADDLNATIAGANAVLENIQKGKGTLGKLVADEQLHREMVNLIENLQTMTDNISRLVTMWREQGLLAKEEKK